MTEAGETAGSHGGPKLVFWHASGAKNAVHAFAMRSELQRIRRAAETQAAAGLAASAGGSPAAGPLGNNPEALVLRSLALISCDCDNVFDNEFVVEALRTLMASRSCSANPAQAEPPLSPACYAAGRVQRLTGRVAYWASDFLRIGGYDEEDGIVGMGYESHDICHRLVRATDSRASGRGHALTKSLGLAVSNKVGSTYDEDRHAKLENCHPRSVRELKTPDFFVYHNSRQMERKTMAGELVRNVRHHGGGGGAPNLFAPLRLLLEAHAASTAPPWAATQAWPTQARGTPFGCLLFPAGPAFHKHTPSSCQQQPTKASQQV